jgi:hypothetical protein
MSLALAHSLATHYELNDGDVSDDEMEADLEVEHDDENADDESENSVDEEIRDDDSGKGTGKKKYVAKQKSKTTKKVSTASKAAPKKNNDKEEKKNEWAPGAPNITTPLPRILPAFPPKPAPPRTPFEILQLFLPFALITGVCQWTISYSRMCENSTFTITANEMYAFIAVNIYMSIDQLPDMHMYWSDEFKRTFITQLFTRDRFISILSYFSLCKSKDINKFCDAASHVADFISYLNESFPIHFWATQNLCIDESIVAFKGRSDIRVFDPSKPHRFGYKIYGLASSNYMRKIVLYDGSDEVHVDGKMYDLVLSLVQGYENKGHILFTDNYYTSLKLLDKLASAGIAMCGSVRLERVHKSLKQSVTTAVLKNMNRGNSIYYHNENRCMVVWKDAKYVKLLFNHLCSPSDSTSLLRWGEGSARINLPCPRAIRDYFYAARAVDVLNQLHYSYPIGRKSKSARSRLVWWLIDICIVNAYTIWAVGRYRPKQLDFRLSLMHEMASAHLHDQSAAAESVQQLPVVFHWQKTIIRLSPRFKEHAWCALTNQAKEARQPIFAALAINTCTSANASEHTTASP